jgi:hypothetical protein
MAPSIPTHRPVLTATRAALLVAVVACASSVYMALASAKTQGAQGTEWVTAAGACPAVDSQHAAR